MSHYVNNITYTTAVDRVEQMKGWLHNWAASSVREFHLIARASHASAMVEFNIPASVIVGNIAKDYDHICAEILKANGHAQKQAA